MSVMARLDPRSPCATRHRGYFFGSRPYLERGERPGAAGS